MIPSDRPLTLQQIIGNVGVYGERGFDDGGDRERPAREELGEPQARRDGRFSGPVRRAK